VRDRYDRLHTWRKDRARARGVESDVILPRTALWDLARRPPRTHGELAHITDLGPWRRGAYGEEILALLSRAALRRVAPDTHLGNLTIGQLRKRRHNAGLRKICDCVRATGRRIPVYGSSCARR
jgi:ribonuclease D